jgi:pimeloyl-ACP methyl ester carboxylesterase
LTKRWSAAAAGAIALTGGWGPISAGAAGFHACSQGDSTQCATLTVPLDRSGAVPGTTPLFVVRERAGHPRRPPIVLVTGGPGQAGSDLIGNATAGGPFAPNTLHRDVIAFDPRGTGRSGLLRCPPFERAKSFLATDAAAGCWSSLGARRYAYTSRSVADDIDAIRQAVGAPKIALYGISYGTSIAQTYARAYPQNVDRVILDSSVDPGGGDMLYGPTFAATSRVLRALCAGSRCRGVTADPVADFAALVRALPAAGLPGKFVGDDGRPHAIALTRFDLIDLLLDGDFSPDLRGGLPAAVHSAVAGDTAPIMRLLRRALRADVSDFIHPSSLSIADYAATVCEEGPFPWTRTAGPDERRAQVAAAVAAIPPASLLPWDPASALASDFVATCLRWPATPQPPDLGGAYPDVPVLVLSGEDDTRTPLEGARGVAAHYPHAILRTFPHSGHDVVDGPAGPDCAWADVRSFLAARAVGSCRGGARAPTIDPLAPASLDALRPLGHGRDGRVLRAVALTLADLDNELANYGRTIPGLRAGSAHGEGRGVRLRRYTYVPGVALTGLLAATTTVRISGVVRGSLRVHGRHVTLTIGGRRLTARVALDLARGGRDLGRGARAR